MRPTTHDPYDLNPSFDTYNSNFSVPLVNGQRAPFQRFTLKISKTDSGNRQKQGLVIISLLLKHVGLKDLAIGHIVRDG